MNLAIVQARISSSRLPGKVLLPVLEKPMLLRQYQRIEYAKNINKIVIATSTEKDDDVIARMCAENSITCYRGSLHDVLERFYKCALAYGATNIIRITGDCPLVDADIIDKVIKKHITNDYDYTSNTIKPTYPDGLDVEVMTFKALQRAWQSAMLSSQREHVTTYIRGNPEKFKLHNVANKHDLSYLRLTVDEPEDYELVKIIYTALYGNNNNFGIEEILKWFQDNPDMLSINSQYERNEGYYKSIINDKLDNEKVDYNE